jgi:hypothetical protein
MEMMMKIHSLVVSALLAAFCGALYVQAQESAPAEAPAKQKPAVTEAVYVCPDCHAAALKPGTCACGKELVKMHLLGTKDGNALLCACGAECKCDFKGMKDGKCACGKEIKEAGIKGLYCCPKGCPVLSKKSRKCACGDEMVQAE